MEARSGFQLRQGGPEVYERSWVKAQMRPAARELISTAGVRPGDKVIDIACGTGVVAREAARLTGSASDVTGTDVNDDMIQVAEQLAAEADLDGIVWLRCDAAEIPVTDGEFDVALCQQGLQFMPDKPAAMSEMARVLKPGGRLALSVWKSRSALGAAFNSVLDRQFGKGTTAPWDLIYSLGDRDRLHELAEGAGLHDVHVTFDVKFVRDPDPRAFVATALSGSPIAGTMAELSDSEQSRLIGEIVLELADFQDDDGLAVPTHCLTLCARR